MSGCIEMRYRKPISSTVANKVALACTGVIVLVSLALGMHVHPYWYGLTAFMGANLMQASVTGFCPVAFLVNKLAARTETAAW